MDSKEFNSYVDVFNDIVRTSINDFDLASLGKSASELSDIIKVFSDFIKKNSSSDFIKNYFSDVVKNSGKDPIVSILESISANNAHEDSVDSYIKSFENKMRMSEFGNSVKSSDFVSNIMGGTTDTDLSSFIDKIMPMTTFMKNAEMYSDIASLFKDMNGGKDMKVAFRNSKNNIKFHDGQYSGYFDERNNTIFINTDSMFKYGVDENGEIRNEFIENLFHEVTHTITKKLLEKGNNLENGNRLISNIKEHAESLGIDTSNYGFENISEALSELFDGNFYDKLKDIKFKKNNLSEQEQDGIKKSFINYVFEAIRDFFNKIFNREKNSSRIDDNIPNKEQYANALDEVKRFFNELINTNGEMGSYSNSLENLKNSNLGIQYNKSEYIPQVGDIVAYGIYDSSTGDFMPVSNSSKTAEVLSITQKGVRISYDGKEKVVSTDNLFYIHSKNPIYNKDAGGIDDSLTAEEAILKMMSSYKFNKDINREGTDVNKSLIDSKNGEGLDSVVQQMQQYIAHFNIDDSEVKDIIIGNLSLTAKERTNKILELHYRQMSNEWEFEVSNKMEAVENGSYFKTVKNEEQNELTEEQSVFSKATLHSGGAVGSDTYWGEMATKYGVGTQNHYYDKKDSKHKPKNANKEVSREELNEGWERVKVAANFMYGSQPSRSSLLDRDWSQVKHSDAIFAVGTIVPKGHSLLSSTKVNDGNKNIHKARLPFVNGGTSYAVAMAILANKPVFVFEQNVGKWFRFNNDQWEECDTPRLTDNFAGIGTREINEAGKKAIEEVFEKTNKEGLIDAKELSKGLNNPESMKFESKYKTQIVSKLIESNRKVTLNTNNDIYCYPENLPSNVNEILNTAFRDNSGEVAFELPLKDFEKFTHLTDKNVIRVENNDYVYTLPIVSIENIAENNSIRIKANMVIDHKKRYNEAKAALFDKAIRPNQKVVSKENDKFAKQEDARRALGDEYSEAVDSVTRLFEMKVSELEEEYVNRIQEKINNEKDEVSKWELMSLLDNHTPCDVIKEFSVSYIKDKVKEDIYIMSKYMNKSKYLNFDSNIINKDNINDMFNPSIMDDETFVQATANTPYIVKTLIQNIRNKNASVENEEDILGIDDFTDEIDYIMESCEIIFENYDAISFDSNSNISKNMEIELYQEFAGEGNVNEKGEDMSDNTDEDSEDDDDTTDNEAQTSEQLFSKPAKVSKHSTISKELKSELSKIIQYNHNGIAKTNLIGLPVYIDEEFAYSLIQSEVAECDNLEDSLAKLAKTVDKYPFIKPFYEKLIEEDENGKYKNQQLVSAYFSDFEANKRNLYVLKRVKYINDEGKEAVSIRSYQVGKIAPKDVVARDAKYNIFNGLQLNRRSIYTTDSRVDIKNIYSLTQELNNAIQNAKSLVNDFATEANNEENVAVKELFDKIKETIASCGFFIDDNIIDNILRSERTDNDMKYDEQKSNGKIRQNWQLISDALLSMMKIENGKAVNLTQGESTKIDDFASNESIEKISTLIGYVKETTVDTGVRENNKQTYIYGQSSYESRLVNKLTGRNKMEFIESEYGDLRFFQTRHDDGSKHWWNAWLNELTNLKQPGMNGKKDFDLLYLLHDNKVEYEDLSDGSYAETLISQYFAPIRFDKYYNSESKHALDKAYFASPIPADASSCEFYKAKRRTGKKAFDRMMEMFSHKNGDILGVLDENGNFHGGILREFLNKYMKENGIPFKPNKDQKNSSNEDVYKMVEMLLIGTEKKKSARQLLKEGEIDKANSIIEKVLDTKMYGFMSEFETFLEMTFVAKQEIERANAIIKRDEQRVDAIEKYNKRIRNGESVALKDIEGWTEPIQYYDIKRKLSFKKDGDKLYAELSEIKDKGGYQFKFFPSLNSRIDMDRIQKLEEDNSVSLNSELFKEIMNTQYQEYYKARRTWVNQGVVVENKNEHGSTFRFKNNLTNSVCSKVHNRSVFDVMSKDYFWQSSLATALIEELTITDQALYKNANDFQKRYKEVYAPSKKLCVSDKIKYSKEKERTMYLKDAYAVSDYEIINMIEEVMGVAVKNGEILQEPNGDAVNDILYGYKNINVADAQGLRNITSYMRVLNMSGQLTTQLEHALLRIDGKEKYTGTEEEQRKQRIKDNTTICQTIKPFVFSNNRIESGIDGYGQFRVGTQCKNSEFVMFWITQIGKRYANQMSKATNNTMAKISAINKFMDAYDIDVVQFESAIKTGGQGAVELEKTEKEALKEGLDNEDTYYNYLIENCLKDNKLNPEIVHELNYRDYGIQNPTPEHAIDVEQLVGSQLRRLNMADIPENAVFFVNGRKMNKREYIFHYNALITENILEAFRKLDNIFQDPKQVERVLLEQMQGDSQYTPDMIKAVQLKEHNGKYYFDLISDPVIAKKVESLVNSIIRNRITKQKIKGGSCIQVSCYGCEGLKLVKGDDGKSIKYAEALLPCYSRAFFEALMDEDGFIDFKKLNDRSLFDEETAEKIMTCIGYRIPTEDKYSMLPIRIVGFLPANNGSSIMLPKEITTLSGSDFDIDKMYLMFHEFRKVMKFKFSTSDKFAKMKEIIDNHKNLSVIKESLSIKDKEGNEIDIDEFIEKTDNDYENLKERLYHNNHPFNTEDIDLSRVDIKEVPKVWKEDKDKPEDKQRSNKSLRIYIKGHHNKGYFELVQDIDKKNLRPNGQYSVHFKTGDANTGETYGSTKEERQILYEELIKAIPDGAKVSTWGNVSKGGLIALNKVTNGFKKVNERTVKDRDGKELKIGVFQKNSDEFTKSTNAIKNELRKNRNDIYKKYTDSIENIYNSAKGGNPICQNIINELIDNGIKPVQSVRFIKYNESKINEHTQMEYADEAAKNSVQARNNQFIDCVYAQLTSSATFRSFANPGSFDIQKRAARFFEIAERVPIEKLKEVLNTDNTEEFLDKLDLMSTDDLNDLISNYSEIINPLSPTTQVYFHGQNCGGGKMIGIYANNNVAHALMQYTNLHIKDSSIFTLDGKKLNMLNSINPIISKMSAGNVAASVDNVKDPVLAWLLQNPYTADPSTLLIRLGYEPKIVGCLMRQPIMMKAVDLFKKGYQGDKKSTFVQACKEMNIFMSDKEGEELSNFEIKTRLENMFSEIKDDKNGYFNANKLYSNLFTDKGQVQVAALLYHILGISEDLSILTSCTRADTQNGGLKPSIAANIAKNRKIDKVMKKVSNRDSNFHLYIGENYGSPIRLTRNIIDDNSPLSDEKGKKTETYSSIRKSIYESPCPMVNAFDYCGIQASKRFFGKYFYQYNDAINDILDEFERLKGPDSYLTEKECKIILEDIMIMWMSQIESFGNETIAESDGTQYNLTIGDKRKLFVETFPHKFMKSFNESEELKNIDFLQVIKAVDVVDPATGNTIKILKMDNVGDLSDAQKRLYSEQWEKMFFSNDDVQRNLAEKLLIYSYFRNGLGFSPDAFGHLAPLMRTMLYGYRDTLRKLLTSPKDEINGILRNFVDQFIRNHPNSSFVKKINLSESTTNGKFRLMNLFKLTKELANQDEESFTYTDILVVDKNNRNLFYKNGELADYVNINDNLYKKVYSGDYTLAYKRISTLGFKNTTDFSEFKEYNIDGIEKSMFESNNKIKGRHSSIKESDIIDNIELMQSSDIADSFIDERTQNYDVVNDVVDELNFLTEALSLTNVGNNVMSDKKFEDDMLDEMFNKISDELDTVCELL